MGSFTCSLKLYGTVRILIGRFGTCWENVFV